MYGILDTYGPWPAWCFDGAVMAFGMAVENELQRVEGKNQKEMDRKTERLLQKWLGLPRKFREPMATKYSDVAEQFSLKGEIGG